MLKPREASPILVNYKIITIQKKSSDIKYASLKNSLINQSSSMVKIKENPVEKEKN
jgi:hypothetical protein